jgi:hypothetical protein
MAENERRKMLLDLPWQEMPGRPRSLRLYPLGPDAERARCRDWARLAHNVRRDPGAYGG